MPKIYPTLLQSANNINSNAWFDINVRKNNKYNKKKRKKTIFYDYVDTLKIVIHFTDKQKQIVNKWFDDCIDVYNLTNTYIKQHINNINFKKLVNYYNLRQILTPQLKYICKQHNMTKHTADYNVKHCVEMYKSSFSNHKDINKFDIKNLDKNRRRKNIIIEPQSVSSKRNSFFTSQLGEINTNLNLNIIKQNSVLQYDTIKNTYTIITPTNVSETKSVEQYHKCGIDIGARTFLTVYSYSNTYEIGAKISKTIDDTNKKLYKIQKLTKHKKISEKQSKKVYNKYSLQIQNKINDLHNKSANFLLSKYRKIIIGKVSTKQMISNLNKTKLNKLVKKRLMTLSHYRFRMKLKQMSVKYGTKIIEHDEYLTSKTCSRCKHIKDDLGSSKTYNCTNCNLIIDRDINASMNIYNEKPIRRSVKNHNMAQLI